MRMKKPQGYKRVKGLCLCHNEEHTFRIVFRTLHRQKFEVVGHRDWEAQQSEREEASGGRG